MMDSPTWRTIEGQGGCVTYDNAWLCAHAVEWHLSNDGEKVVLHYLASEPMPLTNATMQAVTSNPPLTPEQENMVRRIVAEEIKRLEKRITNVVIYDLSQRTKLMSSKKEQL